MYFSGGGNCLAYSDIQSSNSLVYTGDIQLTLLFREMAVLMSIMIVWILFSLSVYSCSDSLACSLAKLKYDRIQMDGLLDLKNCDSALTLPNRT